MERQRPALRGVLERLSTTTGIGQRVLGSYAELVLAEETDAAALERMADVGADIRYENLRFRTLPSTS